MPATQVSKSQCIEIQSNSGYYLLKDAAYAWDRSVAAFGKRVLITGAWRSYETQVQIFDSEKHPTTGRYVRGNRAGQSGYTTDVRGRTANGGLYRDSWWTRKAGTAAAAVPGTSNHGGGVAVDVKTRREDGDPSYDVAVIFGSWTDADRTRFLRVAAEHGWDDDEGRSVNELWHLTYYPDHDRHRGVKPQTILQEDDMFTDADRQQLDQLHAKLLRMFTENDQQVDVVDGVRRGDIMLRRIEARQIADEATPAAADVDVAAEDVADALLVKLTPAVAKGVADALAARLAQ